MATDYERKSASRYEHMPLNELRNRASAIEQKAATEALPQG
jgi:hypothetical protein